METTTATPANTPTTAVAAPAVVAQSATPAVPAPETPTTAAANTANPAPATPAVEAPPADPFDPAYLQKRIDAYINTKKDAPAAAAPDAATAAAAAAPAADAPVADPAAASAATAETPAANEPAAELIVELPPRNPNGVPLRIAAPDPATADALRRMQNGYMRGEQARELTTRAEQALARVREIEVMAQADPLSLYERMPQPERVNLARTILAEHFEDLKPTIEKWWNDDSERRLERADSIEKRGTARQSFQSQMTVNQQIQTVTNAVRGLIPEAVDATDASEFFQDAVVHLANVARGRESGIVTPEEVPQLLAKRLTRYGFTAKAGATPAAPTATPAASVSATPAAAPAPSAPAATTPAVAVQDAVRVHALNAQRAAAAATTTVGAGATPVLQMPKPPKGLTIEQTADWYIQQSKARASGQ